MAQEAFVICDNLVKIYKIAELEVVALQGLDLVVGPGELLGIVGASGSGKSTLMNVLGGLDRPSAGRAWVDGLDLLKLSNAEMNDYRRTRVGFVWQQGARNLIPYLNALENIKLPMTLAGQAGRVAQKRAEELLLMVELSDRKAPAFEGIGGEQQRVAIVAALANNPKLLWPTGRPANGFSTALTIYQMFQRLNRDRVTTLIVSHDPTIARHVNRVVAIRDGKLATETVRARGGDGANGAQMHSAGAEEIFEELTVLDSAGRLQIPKEFLEHFGIKGRARLELTEEGILILPTDNVDHVRDAEALASELVEAKRCAVCAAMNRWVRGEHKNTR